uniref:CSON001556 protein n=1 Tax=Culicoides sonorensis TaxID=179676 RepID=A0A336LVZ3_CULSO
MHHTNYFLLFAFVGVTSLVTFCQGSPVSQQQGSAFNKATSTNTVNNKDVEFLSTNEKLLDLFNKYPTNNYPYRNLNPSGGYPGIYPTNMYPGYGGVGQYPGIGQYPGVGQYPGATGTNFLGTGGYGGYGGANGFGYSGFGSYGGFY